jgi:hypothetical protein
MSKIISVEDAGTPVEIELLINRAIDDNERLIFTMNDKAVAELIPLDSYSALVTPFRRNESTSQD